MAKRSYLKLGGEIRLGRHDRVALVAIDELPSVDASAKAPRYRLRFSGLIDGSAFCAEVWPGQTRFELRPDYSISFERIGRERVDFTAQSPEHISVQTGGAETMGTPLISEGGDGEQPYGHQHPDPAGAHAPPAD